MALVAALIYRSPSKHLRVIAVTGTCGKTTTCHLIADILAEAGYKVGMATTIGFRIGDQDFVNDTKMTMVGRFAIQRLLRKMVDSGCTYAVIEVTSHGLIQSRLAGVAIDTAVMTNLTGDHVEYHGGFEEYKKAKGKLFALVSRTFRKNGVPKRIFLNRDDPHFDYFNAFSADEKYTYGVDSTDVFARATDVHFEDGGSNFKLSGVSMHLNLPGIFNVYNTTAAAAVALTEGVSLDVIVRALAKTSGLPGRYEHVLAGQDFPVCVDYAHTPEALEGLLKVYRDATKGKLFVVFGSTGGGRDKAKRSVMGKVADEYGDVVIVTDDDPYSEDHWSIVNDVARGVSRKEGENFWKIASRKRAIEYALFLAQKGDCVVIAGKGCEPVQMIFGERRKWDDRDIVRTFFAR